MTMRLPPPPPSLVEGRKRDRLEKQHRAAVAEYHAQKTEKRTGAKAKAAEKVNDTEIKAAAELRVKEAAEVQDGSMAEEETQDVEQE